MTHLLVVEDEPATQKMMQKMLSKGGGYDVTLTEEVREGLALIRSGQVALVLMDVSLNNTRYEGRLIDGLAFARLIKAEPAGAGVPILLVTAHALVGAAERMLAESGADDYIAKPFADSKSLVDKVRATLAKVRG